LIQFIKSTFLFACIIFSRNKVKYFFWCGGDFHQIDRGSRETFLVLTSIGCLPLSDHLILKLSDQLQNRNVSWHLKNISLLTSTFEVVHACSHSCMISVTQNLLCKYYRKEEDTSTKIFYALKNKDEKLLYHGLWIDMIFGIFNPVSEVKCCD